MGILSVFLLVLFIIVSILLVLLVLVQNEDGDSLGGVFAGNSSSAFGSRSGNILTRASSVLGAAFLVLSLALALVNRGPGDSGVEAAGRALNAPQSGDWWDEGASPATGVIEAGPEEGSAEEANQAEETGSETENSGANSDEKGDEAAQGSN